MLISSTLRTTLGNAEQNRSMNPSGRASFPPVTNAMESVSGTGQPSVAGAPPGWRRLLAHSSSKAATTGRASRANAAPRSVGESEGPFRSNSRPPASRSSVRSALAAAWRETWSASAAPVSVPSSAMASR